jgi:DNA-binding response OmpR family regulator
MNQDPRLILIVDDDEDICEVLKFFLEAEGYRVTVAFDGFDAWRQIQTGDLPALILLDWMMPRMDGEQFLTRLREDRRSEIAVVILSGNDTVRKRAEELKATCCLTKPVEFDELLTTVKRCTCLP